MLTIKKLLLFFTCIIGLFSSQVYGLTPAQYETILFSTSGAFLFMNLTSPFQVSNKEYYISHIDGLKDQGDILEIVELSSKKYNLDKYLILSIMKAESNFNNDARSKVGAVGFMQVMPATARDMGFKNIENPMENIHAGSLYFRKMLDKFDKLELAIAAYNAGPKNVKKYKGIPPFEETQNYVKKVLTYYKDIQNKDITLGQYKLFHENYKSYQISTLLGMFVPGGSMFYNERPVKGVQLAIAELGFIFGGSIYYNKYSETNDNDELKNIYNRLYKESFIAVGVLHLYGLIDGLYETYQWNKNTQQTVVLEKPKLDKPKLEKQKTDKSNKISDLNLNLSFPAAFNISVKF